MSVVAANEVHRDWSEEEWRLRKELAACYRLVAHFGMTDLVFTHISARLPGPEDHFLINPYGLLFEEVCASNLVKVDQDGEIVGHSDYPVNPTGFIIHSAIHMGRPDVVCVLHTHTIAGMAVAAQTQGLLPLSQTSMQFFNRVAYHDYEGLSLDMSERERLQQDLGQHNVLILRNHGLLTCGSSVSDAYISMHYLHRSCEVQVTAQAGGREVVTPSDEVCHHASEQMHRPSDDRRFAWEALVRLVEREYPDYAT